jgi:hypothetical protein
VNLEMPRSELARTQIVEVPFSEAAIYCGLAGKDLLAVEEDLYMNGNEIPMSKRAGCFVNNIPLLKAEAGWKDS